MDEYNVLVLMEKDRESGFFTLTVDSYTIGVGIELVESIYLQEENEKHYVYLTLTTKDVEDWEYYGVYELYNEEIFKDMALELLDGSGEYNPRWIIKLEYSDNRLDMSDLLNRIIELHRDELDRIRPILVENKEKYIAESNEETEEEQ